MGGSYLVDGKDIWQTEMMGISGSAEEFFYEFRENAQSVYKKWVMVLVTSEYAGL